MMGGLPLTTERLGRELCRTLVVLQHSGPTTLCELAAACGWSISKTRLRLGVLAACGKVSLPTASEQRCIRSIERYS